MPASCTSPTRRREFLRRAAALTFVASAGPVATAAAEDLVPIIDTHQHLWDLSKFRLPWLASAPKLDRSFFPDDYREATRGLNVVKAVYMEVDVEPSQQRAEAEAVIDLCRTGKTPTVAAVISGRPSSADFKGYLDRFKSAAEIKGLRQVLQGPATPPGYALDADFRRGVRLLGDAGLMFDVCMRSGELSDAAKLIDACPNTRFILDHCGNADVLAADRSAWKAGLDAVAKRERVVCKVSGIVASTRGSPWSLDDLAPIVNHVLDAFGPDRVMFGGDWPVCTLGATYRQWVEALKAIVRNRPEVEQRKLFHDNAVRVYRLGKT